ncbi:MAG: hypothetical protein RL063_660 [Pseudomonadota bacterium]
MVTITQKSNKWLISGPLLMDYANEALTQSTALSMNDKLEIDFSEVTDIDTAALSLIMEWQRRALASKCTISFANLPANLNSLAELYGVTSFILVTKT